MNHSILKRIFNLLLIFIFVVFFNNSVLAGGSFTFKWGQDQEPEQHQVKHKHKRGGPPAHAPAHGYRAKYQYRYYPSQKVYHDTNRGLYFYLKGDNWEVGASLPRNIKRKLGDYVKLELDTDIPYIHHDKHIKEFPSRDSKKRKNNLWSKLIFVLLYEHASK